MERLKDFKTFSKRSGIEPKFDTGDIISNGNIFLLVLDITSTSDKAWYSIIDDENKYRPLEFEYHETNKQFNLVKKGDLKFQYYLANDGLYGGDLYDKATGKVPYPIWFEKQYNKEINKK